MTYDYDLYVIGAGSGGVRASRIAAGLGARVAVCEEGPLGGTCVNLGCVPKKLLVYASSYGPMAEDAAGYGWDMGTPTFDWAALIAAKNAEITRLNGIYDRMLRNAGVTIHSGRGRITGPHSVEVNGEIHTAERIIIAVGGRPTMPSIPGGEHTISSNEAFFLEALPKRVLVVGAGYIGVEFAGIFRSMGSEVTLLQRNQGVLRWFDHDIRSSVEAGMRGRGVNFHFDATLTSIVKKADGLHLTFSDGTDAVVDCVLRAIGRNPYTADLGLDSVGVDRDKRGAIVVDAGFATNIPSIFAVGDVIERATLTPVALAEGMALVRHFYADEPIGVTYDLIPTAIFSQPQAATVGLMESEAREQHLNIVIYRSVFRPMLHTLAGRDERMMMKLIVDGDTDRVVGCHMVGDGAAEIIQGLAVAMRAGATKTHFDRTLGIHPTAAEEFVTMRTPSA